MTNKPPMSLSLYQIITAYLDFNWSSIQSKKSQWRWRGNEIAFDRTIIMIETPSLPTIEYPFIIPNHFLPIVYKWLLRARICVHASHAFHVREAIPPTRSLARPPFRM